MIERSRGSSTQGHRITTSARWGLSVSSPTRMHGLSIHHLRVAATFHRDIDDQSQVLINAEASVGADDNRRFTFLHDRRTFQRCTGTEGIAVVHGAADVAGLRE